MTLSPTETGTKSEATRLAILRALARVIATRGVSEFSVQSVADEAGVSHRTIYRHFANREALLEGLTRHLDDWMLAEGLPGVPTDFEATLEVVPVAYRFFEAHAEMVEAMVVVGFAPGVEPTPRQRQADELVRGRELCRRRPHTSRTWCPDSRATLFQVPSFKIDLPAL